MCVFVISCFSCIGLYMTLGTVAHQAPLSMGFSRQEYWSGLSCPPPGDLPNPGIKPRSPTLQTDSLPTKPSGKPKNTGVGSLSLLQGVFLTQESNLGSPALQADSLPAELPRKSREGEWEKKIKSRKMAAPPAKLHQG